MSSRYLAGAYSAGYVLTGAYTYITLGPNGSIGGSGLIGGANQSYAILNVGQIATGYAGATGVSLQAGGTVTNGSGHYVGALIAGNVGSTGTAGGAYQAGGAGGGGGLGVSLSGGAGSLTNYGTIRAGTGGTGGAGGDHYSGGNGGSGGSGVSLSNSGSVQNAGTIFGGSGGRGGESFFITRITAGDGGAGIILSSGGIIGNSGIVKGGYGGAAFRSWGPGKGGNGINSSMNGSIDNSGTIRGGYGGQGYNGFSGGGGAGGTAIAGGGSVRNTGKIFGGGAGFSGNVDRQATGPGGSGISFGDGGSIDNSGTIAGGGNGGWGIYLSHGSIANSGSITGGSGKYGGGIAIYVASGGAITNSGFISGGSAGSAAYSGLGYDGGAAISLFGGGSIGNSGTIRGGAGGAGFAHAGKAGAGISVGSGGTVSNSSAGVISGGQYGVAKYGSGTVTNLGTIAATEAYGIGVSLQGLGATVVNSGTISGGRGAVKFLGGGSKRLIVEPGAKFIGTVSATGTAALELGSAASAGTLTGVGSQYRGFTSLEFDIGSRWTVEGSASGLPGTIIGFAGGDTIDVDGFVAVSDSYGGDGLVLTDSVGNSVTLGIQGSFTNLNFAIASDGKGGTDVLRVSPQNFSLGNFAANAGGWTTQDSYPRVLGDVNGDGKDDIVGFGSNGVYVSLAQGSGKFASPILATGGFGTDTGGWTSNNIYPRALGDVNGDDKADIVGFGSNGVYVALGKADGTFGNTFLATSGFATDNGGWTSQNTYPRELADVNGDGKADLVGFGSNGVHVALGQSDGTFGNTFLATSGFATDNGGWTSQNTYPRELADVNGDGRADVVGFGSNGVYVALANADGTFGNTFLATAGFGSDTSGWTSNDLYPRELADVNGDGRADIVAFGSDGVYTALGNSDGTFQSTKFDFGDLGTSTASGGWTSQNIYPRLVGDVTGDGRADIVAFGSDGVYVVDAALADLGFPK